MEQIPNNSSEDNFLSDFEVIKKDFKKFFSNLMESNESIHDQLQELRESKQGEISQSDANIAISDKINDKKISFFQQKTNFIIRQLKEKLDYIVINYSTTVIDDIFDILISILIQKYKQRVNIFFISLEQIYEVFYLFGFRIIPSETLDKLTGALQWDIILPDLLNYNFIKDYSNKLLKKKNVSKEIKNKTWTLVELTRIRKQEFDKKSIKFRRKEDFYKI